MSHYVSLTELLNRVTYIEILGSVLSAQHDDAIPQVTECISELLYDLTFLLDHVINWCVLWP